MSSSAPRAPFVVLVGALLVSGLAGLLFLHTALAEDSFRLHDLKESSARLADRQQALEQEIATEASPERLALQARRLGMVRSENPAFIRLADGKILGRPAAGKKPPAPSPAKTVAAPVAARQGAGAAAKAKQVAPPASGRPIPRATATPGRRR